MGVVNNKKANKPVDTKHKFVVKIKPPYELKIKVIEFTWQSGITAAREKQPISSPHWSEATSATIPEEEKIAIQHYDTGSKKPGVYLIKDKGADTAEIKLNIHLVDPDGELTDKKYTVRGSLGDLKMQSTESFVIASGIKTLTMKLTLPDALTHIEGDITLQAIPEEHNRGLKPIENTPRLEAFVIYDKPMAFYSTGVWVEAMRLMFKKAGVAGLKQPDDISAKVTAYCHSEHGMTYDTKDGMARFMSSELGGNFTLFDYIKKTNPNNVPLTIVNCYDQAAAVQAFSGCLGVEVKWKYQEPFGYIKTTNLVGVGPCNNPFGSSPVVADNDPDREPFGNHAFVETNVSIYIRDACAGPHNEMESLRSYLDASIDTSRTVGLNSSAAYLDYLLTTTQTTPGVTSVS
ncbi:MAG: hypothetical protein LBF16_07495 [Pseudomonadales bacterium]|jgi:hypothetical protein|nr:hypothetical protein [Pseudomonadales bacterium]